MRVASPSLRSFRGAFALVLLLVALLAVAMSACIIGPKQDDPADQETPGGKVVNDAEATSDTSYGPPDGATGVFDDGGAPGEVDAIAGGDAGASDAPADAPCGETDANEAAAPCEAGEAGGSDAISGG